MLHAPFQGVFFTYNMFERERGDAGGFGADLFDDIPESPIDGHSTPIDARKFGATEAIPVETQAQRDAALAMLLDDERKGYEEERDLSMVIFQDWLGRRVTPIFGAVEMRSLKTTDPLPKDDPKVSGLSNDILAVAPSLTDGTTGKTYAELFGNDIGENIDPEVFPFMEEVITEVRRIIEQNHTAESQAEMLWDYIQRLQKLQRVDEIKRFAAAAA